MIHWPPAEATICTAWAFFPCLQSEATFWKPFPHIGQPIVMSKCLQMCISIQSLLVWWKVHIWHWYSFTPPGWLILSGRALVGITSSGTTTIGYEVYLTDGPGEGGSLEDGSRSDSGGDSGDWSEVGMMRRHLGETLGRDRYCHFAHRRYR